MSQPKKVTAEFERLILPHLNSAYNLARWLLRNEQEAQDVVHDSFLRAHRYFDRFTGSDGRAWLLSIVRNECFSALRRNKMQPVATEDEPDLQSSGDADPEHALMLKQDLQALRGCIEALPPECREALILREFEELSYKEIAVAAGIALGTVMSRLNRARVRLENCLTGKGKDIR